MRDFSSDKFTYGILKELKCAKHILIRLANLAPVAGALNEKVMQPDAIYSITYLIKSSFQNVSAIIAVCSHVFSSWL
jgi:hypothetical protein